MPCISGWSVRAWFLSFALVLSWPQWRKLDLGNFIPSKRLLAMAVTSITAGCYFMGITVAPVADREHGLLMLWMLPVCVTTPARVSIPSRAAPAMRDFNMKQQRLRAIPHNRRTFNSWLP